MFHFGHQLIAVSHLGSHQVGEAIWSPFDSGTSLRSGLQIGHFEKNSRAKKLKTQGKTQEIKKKTSGFRQYIDKIGSRNSIFFHNKVIFIAVFARHHKN